MKPFAEGHEPTSKHASDLGVARNGPRAVASPRPGVPLQRCNAGLDLPDSVTIRGRGR